MSDKELVNILIVDDKVANIFALEQMLLQPGRTFISATTGKEALKTVLNKEIDLIILDVQMPEMDGFEVAQILKSNKRTKDIPIIFASAEKKEHQFMLKGLEEGAIDYLFKPLDRQITEAKVSVLLKLHLQQKELKVKNQILERFALLINNSADIICIINPDTFMFEEVNQAVTNLLGYTLQEVRETSLLLYLTEECRRKVKKFANETSERLTFETQIYHKKGSIRWFEWNVVNKNGLWFSNARDITAVREVEEIKNYLATVVKQSNDAIYLHSPDGKIISWNQGAEKIYGFSEAEALEMKVWNLVPDNLLDEAHAMAEKILNGNQIKSVETKRITKQGITIDVMFSASVINDTDLNIKSVAITERDITRQKKSEQEIKQLNTNLKQNVAQLEVTNKELESFSYSVSHDLRAPLRAINGYANIIQEEYKAQLDDELNRLLQIIRNNANKMGILIDDLLAFSKLGRKELVKTTINTAEMVKGILTEIESINGHQAQIEVKTLLPTEGDAALLHQVFYNLIANAIKYSFKKQEPHIEINSFVQDDEIIYYVKDNGTGFNMDYAHKLFGVFQRLHSDKDFEGTGVGLAIVQRIVVKHGGRAWAEGEVGKGATFYFSLPQRATSTTPV